MADLRAVRAAVSVPVLAKEFVVDRASCPCCGRPARTLSCCWRRSIRPASWPGSSRLALDLGLEPLVEAHDERELERGARDSAPG